MSILSFFLSDKSVRFQQEFFYLFSFSIGYTYRKKFLVSNPYNPILTGFLQLEGYVFDLFLVGQYAYVTNNRNLLVIDIQNPYLPVIAGSCTTSGDRNTLKVYVANNRAYITKEYPEGFRIIDVSNPTSPSLITQYATSYASDIIIRGNIAFLGDGYYGVRVLDISNINQITELGHYSRPGYAVAIYVVGNYIYCAQDYGGFIIYEYTGAGIEESNELTITFNKVKLMIIPNPNLSTYTIEYNITKRGLISLDILDTLGRIKKIIKKEQGKAGSYKLHLDVSDLPAGVYFVRLKQGDEQVVERIVIVK